MNLAKPLLCVCPGHGAVLWTVITKKCMINVSFSFKSYCWVFPSSACLSHYTTVSWHAAGLFAIQIGEYKCFVKGFGCIWAAVPLFKRLLSFQSQVAAGHLFHCVRVFLWVNCVHADWGGQFSGHGVLCWQVLLLLFLFLVIISCLYVEEDSGCPDSWSNFTKNTRKILQSLQHYSEKDSAPALRYLLLCFRILTVTAPFMVLITFFLTFCTSQIK